MPDQNTAAQGGVSIAGVILVLFIVMKVFNLGIIGAWSWWWVMSPLWITPLIVVAIALIIGSVLGVVALAVAAWEHFFD